VPTRLAALGALVTALVCSAVAAAPAGASDPGVTSKTITIGFISDLTGPASSTFFDAAGGIDARVALQNAKGGVDGRKIKVVVKDDATNPATYFAAASDLAGSGVFGVVSTSSVGFGGSKILQQAGIPVTGWGFDGPEWGMQPYTNMFSFYPVTATAFNGNYYTYDYWGRFLKSIGVTKLAGLSYSISPSSQHAIDTTLASAGKHGVSTCYNDKTVQFGGVDFTAAALSMKAAGCNGVTVALVDSSDVAVAQAVKNAGMKAKTIIGGTGYDNTVLSTPSAAAALDGQYMDTQVDFTPPNTPTQAMLNALRKYDPQYKGGLPDYGTYVAYLGADLMIKGLQQAGNNPTRSAFISNLHKVTSYNAGGILPGSVSFSLKNFGTVAMLPKTYCNYFVQLKNDKYTTTNGNKPWCGSLVAGGS